MRKRIGISRFIAFCLAVLLVFGMMPVSAFAAESAVLLGKVHVIIENTTYPVANGAKWDGTLVDKEVNINSSSTMMSTIKEAIESSGYKQVGAENNYIASINGLGEFDGGFKSGWMGTLNDWFTNAGFNAFTVANGTLEADDEIHLMYTRSYGEDIGSSWRNNDKSLKALAVSAGTLTPAFSAKTKDYTLTLPTGTRAVKVIPAAVNKSFQVRTSVDGAKYKYSAQIPVQDGTKIAVECGGPNWPSPNPDGSYTITVKIAKPNTVPSWDTKYPATQSNTIQLGESFSLKPAEALHFNDAEKDELTYKVSVNGGEATAVETDKDGVYHFTPKAAGDYTLHFIANDGQTDSAEGLTVTLNVKDTQVVPQPTNHPPVLKSGVPTQTAQNISLDGSFSLDLGSVFTDADGNALTYKVSINDAAYVPATEKYVYKPAKPGSAILRFRANDGTADSTDTYQVTLQTTSGDKVSQIYSATGSYLYNAVPNPTVSSVGGEWAVIGLARSGFAVDASYYNKYISNVINTLQSGKGIIGKDLCTDYARVTLALTAVGYDVKNVAGYNLLERFSDYDKDVYQGINGPIWALIALDSHNYTIPEAPAGKNQATRENLVEAVLNAQLPNGGWTFFGSQADPDMTGMALQALAPYYNGNVSLRMGNRLAYVDSLSVRVHNAVNAALALLSETQNVQGGFASWGTANVESTAQVIVALTALKIDPAKDERFVKNGNSLLDNLCTFAVEGGGFCHTIGGGVNGMATEQAYYALVAYQYYKEYQKSLYDMGNVPMDEHQPYKAVIDLIDGIGNVTLSKAAIVKAARTAYDKLSDAAKAQVGNYQKLLDAEKELAELMKNVEAVQKLISAIGTVTLEKEQQIQQAEDAYNALSKEERQAIENYELLEKAELKLAQLKHADAVVKLINKIGTVTRNSLPQITAARTAYKELDQLEQVLVSNYALLTGAENTYAKYLNADKVVNLISAIGRISRNSAEPIQAARAGYNALPAEEKDLVTNYNVLLLAEKTFAQLQKPSTAVTTSGSVKHTYCTSGKGTVPHLETTENSGNGTFMDSSLRKTASVQSSDTVVSSVVSAIGALAANSDTQTLLTAYRLYSSLSVEQQKEVSNYAVLQARLKQLAEANHKDAVTGIRLDGAAWNMKLTVQAISDEQIQKMKNDFGSNTLLKMYQLTLTDVLSGKEAKLDSNVMISVPMPTEAGKYQKFIIGEYTANGSVRYVPCTVKNGRVVWKTENPHRFALLACAKEASAKLAVKADPAPTETPSATSADLIVWIVVASLAAGVIIIIAVMKIKKRKTNG